MVDNHVGRSTKVWCTPKEERRSSMVNVAQINGSDLERFEINGSYLKGCYSSKTISFI
jgi:hypothetical protein